MIEFFFLNLNFTLLEGKAPSCGRYFFYFARTVTEVGV